MREATSDEARGAVVLAVTGGIAAYKSCEIVRRLGDHGLTVRVAMSRNAVHFVTPTTFAALSGEHVISDLFDDPHPERIAHVRWAEECAVLCVAPATADIIAKMALGVADDFPSTLYLAVTAPVIVAPAMEDHMFGHPAVQANLATLRERGTTIVGPARGALASGRTGPGRMSSPDEIVEAVLAAVGQGGARPLAGRRVVVSAGPTREPLDPVRVITNLSSGRMGFALAAVARELGAEVTVVAGPVGLDAPAGVQRVDVETADEMRRAMLGAAVEADIVVMAAAVSDWRPRERAEAKLKKGEATTASVDLVRNPDILAELVDRRPPGQTVVGFAAETEDLEARTREKLERKGCDLIVGNRVGVDGLGIEAEDNAVLILDRQGGRAEFGPARKTLVAREIWRSVVAFRGRAEGEPR